LCAPTLNHATTARRSDSPPRSTGTVSREDGSWRSSKPRAKCLPNPASEGAPSLLPPLKPPGGRIEEAAGEYRSWMRALFIDLAEQAGAGDPPELARQLQVIYDGAGLTASMDHDPSIATSARAAAEALLDPSLPQRSRP
jgi:hypothetical protein